MKIALAKMVEILMEKMKEQSSPRRRSQSERVEEEEDCGGSHSNITRISRKGEGSISFYGMNRSS